jgi:hypothetical protein
MTDPDHTSLGQDEFLSLRIGGSAERPERLLLIGRPHEGSVRVREWTSNTWNTEGDDYDIDTVSLLEGLERAYADRHPISEEMYRVRQWLTA